MTRDFRPTNTTDVTSKTMKTKSEKQKALISTPKAQRARIKSVAKKKTAKADGPRMRSNIMDGVPKVSFTHAERSDK
tara:strand:- start:11620 stop:11850 length:231 start_codon:yes stop_codon:yes gene_type:complete